MTRSSFHSILMNEFILEACKCEKKKIDKKDIFK
jgi:hypothetical protein